MADTLFRSKYFEDAFPFYIGKYVIAKEQLIREHSHDFVELVYVLEGSAVHCMSGHSYRLKPGDLFVIEPGATHSYTNTGSKEAVVYNVLFDRDLLFRELSLLEDADSLLAFLYVSPFLRKMSVFQPHMEVTGKTRSGLEQHLETLETEFTRKDSGYRLIVKTRMIECMVMLSRFAERAFSCEEKAEVQVTDEHWLQSIVAMLHQNFDKPFSLEQLSRLSGMSVSSFSAKFKAYTGRTLMEFKHELQIREACRLLEETDEKVLTIALKAGFSEAAFFHRVFRRSMGMSPALYRASLHKNKQGRKG